MFMFVFCKTHSDGTECEYAAYECDQCGRLFHEMRESLKRDVCPQCGHENEPEIRHFSDGESYSKVLDEDFGVFGDESDLFVDE